MPTTFCTQITQEAQEPLAGTAARSAGYVLMTWPKRCWGRQIHQSKNLPEHWHDDIQELLGEIPFAMRFIDQKGFDHEQGVRLFFYPENVGYVNIPASQVLETIRAHYFQDRPTPVAGYSIPNPLFLVCTHGKRDACCAKFGQAFYQDAKAFMEEQSINLDVWECSHLGGHRFAATALLLPDGDLYGRLSSSDLPDLWEAWQKSGVLASKYRGNVWIGSPEQVALAWAYAKYDVHKESISIVSQPPSSNSAQSEHIQVQLQVQEHLQTLELEQVTWNTPSSCGDEEPYPAKKRWMIKEVQ